MLIDPRVERMAQVLIGYSLGVKKGWTVSIFAGTAAMPLVQAAYSEVLRVGAHPNVLLDVPGARDMLLTLGNDEQLLHGDPYRLAMTTESDALLRIMSEDNTRSSNNVPPGRQALLQRGLSP